MRKIRNPFRSYAPIPGKVFSSFSLIQLINMFIQFGNKNVIVSFSYMPIRAMVYMGLIFDVIAFALFVSVIVEFFTMGTPIAGWPSLMCVVLVSAGMILTMMGILGEYLWRTFDAARNRPPFIIDEVKEQDK